MAKMFGVYVFDETIWDDVLIKEFGTEAEAEAYVAVLKKADAEDGDTFAYAVY